MQAGDLVTQSHKGFGLSLEAPVIFHILLDLGGLGRRNALGELFAVKEALEDIIRTADSGGTGPARAEELLAQRAPAQAVNGLHLQEEGLPFVKEVIQIRFHGDNVSI